MKDSIDLVGLFDQGRESIVGIVKKIKDDLGEHMQYQTGDYKMLVLLQKLGKAKLKDIAEFSGPKPVVCMHLGVLERKKIVARETDMNDRRNVYYFLTPKGEKYVQDITDKIKSSANGIFGRLDGEDVEKLSTSMKEVNRILAKAAMR